MKPHRSWRRATVVLSASFVVAIAACTSSRDAIITDPAPPPPPVEQLPARYALAQVNGVSLPAEVYAGVYFDEFTGFFRDLRIVASEGYLLLRDDGTYDQRVKMQAYVDGALTGRPNYEDLGRWAKADVALVRFESDYNPNGIVFHGVAKDRTVKLSQEITGGEAGATPREFTYTRP